MFSMKMDDVTKQFEYAIIVHVLKMADMVLVASMSFEIQYLVCCAVALTSLAAVLVKLFHRLSLTKSQAPAFDEHSLVNDNTNTDETCEVDTAQDIKDTADCSEGSVTGADIVSTNSDSHEGEQPLCRCAQAEHETSPVGLRPELLVSDQIVVIHRLNDGGSVIRQSHSSLTSDGATCKRGATSASTFGILKVEDCDDISELEATIDYRDVDHQKAFNRRRKPKKLRLKKKLRRLFLSCFGRGGRRSS